MKARRLRHDELERLAGKVNQDGGDLRVLRGEVHGLSTSVMLSRIVPGSGPRRHRHPHAEIFVVDEGRGTFDVDGEQILAEAGDVILIPPDAWHAFTNSGDGQLRLTAIHENPRPVTAFEDGTRRD
jgi:quercetin dioxygenase-like cupin family protein